MALALSVAQTFVTKLAADLAAQTERQGAVFPVVVRQYQQAVVADAAALTINHTDRNGAALAANAADYTPFSATLPIQRLLDDSVFYQQTLYTLAQLAAETFDQDVLHQAVSFNINAPIDNIATPLSDANILLAVQAILSQNVPVTDQLFFAVSTRIGGQTRPPYSDLLDLANVLDPAKTGDSARGVFLSRRLTRYAGLQILRSNKVRGGGTPATLFNLAFSSSALAFVTCQMGLTNNGTNVQAYSTTPKLCLRVALAFDGSDTQAVTIAARGASVAARLQYGVQVRT